MNERLCYALYLETTLICSLPIVIDSVVVDRVSKVGRICGECLVVSIQGHLGGRRRIVGGGAKFYFLEKKIEMRSYNHVRFYYNIGITY